MHRGLQRTLGSALCCMILLATSAGCTQLSKHSNTLVFGTNTLVGLKVGTDASQKPTVDVGYNRQEVALVPVLANTSVGSKGRDLEPCPGTVETKGDGTVELDIEDCHFRASNNGTDKDSYSTLASFGGRLNGTVGQDASSQATVALAQYFATGIAAQQLALSGGANIVQAGGDTAAKADAAKEAAKAYSQQFSERADELADIRARADAAEQEGKGLIAAAADPVLGDYATAMRGKGYIGSAPAGDQAARQRALSDAFILQDETPEGIEDLEELLAILNTLTP